MDLVFFCRKTNFFSPYIKYFPVSSYFVFYLRVNVKVHVQYNICTGEYWNPVRREEGNLIILTERVREVFAIVRA